MKTLGACGLLLAVAGCTIVPGSDRDAEPGWFAEDEQPDAADLPDVIKTHTITTAILDQNQASAPELPDALADSPENYDYEVGVGDVLQITVWDHPELTIPAGSQRSAQESGNLVHSDGSIFYPYVGKVHVEGMKVTEIREMITERLDDYIESPQVDVAVAGFRSKKIYVTGAVSSPGTY
ncbi:MAG TPA: polysaccharide export protein Wza, partial [Alcanivorax sp.]|nr:polysaccharide export protein Wza [Alcanivorax sp.]